MKEMGKLKKGDRVLVWSLQSFFGGGFLDAEPAFLRQSQSQKSVILCVIRNSNGTYKVDESYEVYREQVKPISKNEWKADKELKKLRKSIMINNSIT